MGSNWKLPMINDILQQILNFITTIFVKSKYIAFLRSFNNQMTLLNNNDVEKIVSYDKIN